ncbi:MAG: 23S rRNA (uracil(1939)-C(5))-methyltransferase RlmD [Eggerthellaceae bacterium]|nr:23S rRNA (uracil(1939)-C(5))-methyltransferase RlmD [Eggerthellaceae bacterium]
MKDCPVAKRCGACQCIDVPYAEQLVTKDAFVRELFADLAPAKAIRPILGMDEPYYYRNKVVSPFAPAPNGRKVQTAKRTKGASKAASKGARSSQSGILTGMYALHSHQLIDTQGCLVENQAANQVVQAIRSIMLKHDMQPYNEDTGQGFIRHAVIRVGHASGEMLVTIVTNGEEFHSSKAFCRELVKRCPAITTIVQNVNTSATNVILGSRERVLYGPGFILDTLCGLSFRISSRSFYQVNALQTEVLYETAMELADVIDARAIIDAYCGTGTIGLVAAKRSGAQVIGVDSVESAIADARQNARHNGIENAQFVAADATQFMLKQAAEGEAVDLVFMDPPRAGSTPDFLDALATLAPARVVYISCNPQTQVRDLQILSEHGYAVKAVQSVDMFPHTKHVETVVLLSREMSRQ